LDRFKNPYINHELSAIALNSVSKFKVRILPSIVQYYELNKCLPPHLMFSWAALLCLYKGVWRGKQTPVNDAPDVIRFFRETWKDSDTRAIARKILSNHGLWGYDLDAITDLHTVLSDNMINILSQEHTERTTLMLPSVKEKNTMIR
jgi:tagaturonate reductase